MLARMQNIKEFNVRCALYHVINILVILLCLVGCVDEENSGTSPGDTSLKDAESSEANNEHDEELEELRCSIRDLRDRVDDIETSLAEHRNSFPHISEAEEESPYSIGKQIEYIRNGLIEEKEDFIKKYDLYRRDPKITVDEARYTDDIKNYDNALNELNMISDTKELFKWCKKYGFEHLRR